MARVALVTFYEGRYRYALEASQVREQTLQPSGVRQIAASAWLAPDAERLASRRWLTLSDPQGPWQLGVAGAIELIDWPADALYPLPALLKARATTPGLCGLALDEQGVAFWLLEAARLSPFSLEAKDR